MPQNTSFPTYRKLTNGRSFYKIVNETTFIELQLMGTKIIRYEINAKQYPELLRIKDMIELANGFEVLTEDEFMNLINQF